MAYSLVAVDFMSEAALHMALARVARGAASGMLRPLPQVVHSLDRVQAALRQMSQARHVGKVVVRAPALAAQQFQKRGALGAVLIAGGLGTLGSQFAEWLAAQEVTRMYLLGRSGRWAEQHPLLLHPESPLFSAAVTLTACDAGSTEDSSALFRAAGDGPAGFAGRQPQQPLAGMVQAGGVLADGVLSAQTLRSLRTVVAPKVHATLQLDAATAHQPRAFSVLFSSVASLLGSPGQANYAAANAVLDAMTAVQQQRGAAAVSVQWGAWAGAGMAAGSASTAARVERTGMALLRPQQGLAVLEGLLLNTPPAAGVPLLAASAFIWDTFLRRFGSPAAVPPLFAAFAAATAPPLGAADAHSNALSLPGSGDGRHRKAATTALSAADRKAAVQAQVAEAVSAILGGSVGADEPLMAAGLDSLGAVELKNSLEGRLGLQLPGTLVFDYPTVSALVRYIDGALPSVEAGGDHESDARWSDGAELLTPLGDPAPSPAAVVVAVTGLACRSAGDAIFSCAAADAIAVVPLDRWDLEQVALQASWAGCMHGSCSRPHRPGCQLCLPPSLPLVRCRGGPCPPALVPFCAKLTCLMPCSLV